jgi:hypothetical protein
MRKPHSSNLANVTVETEANELPPSSHREKTPVFDDDERIANEFFGCAIAAIGPGKVAAPLLGLSEAHLSDMRNGNRAVTLPRVIRAARKNRAAGVALIRMLAKLVGGVRVTEQRAVSKAALRSQLVMSLESNPAILRVVMADAAEKLGVDEEEAASVWDEPTDVDAAK